VIWKSGKGFAGDELADGAERERFHIKRTRASEYRCPCHPHSNV
jgi:hypothetical protein